MIPSDDIDNDEQLPEYLGIKPGDTFYKVTRSTDTFTQHSSYIIKAYTVQKIYPAVCVGYWTRENDTCKFQDFVPAEMLLKMETELWKAKIELWHIIQENCGITIEGLENSIKKEREYLRLRYEEMGMREIEEENPEYFV